MGVAALAGAGCVPGLSDCGAIKKVTVRADAPSGDAGAGDGGAVDCHPCSCAAPGEELQSCRVLTADGGWPAASQ